MYEYHSCINCSMSEQFQNFEMVVTLLNYVGQYVPPTTKQKSAINMAITTRWPPSCKRNDVILLWITRNVMYRELIDVGHSAKTYYRPVCYKLNARTRVSYSESKFRKYFGLSSS